MWRRTGKNVAAFCCIGFSHKLQKGIPARRSARMPVELGDTTLAQVLPAGDFPKRAAAGGKTFNGIRTHTAKNQQQTKLHNQAFHRMLLSKLSPRRASIRGKDIPTALRGLTAKYFRTDFVT